ncbi:MAG: winged helix-turn-helix transcriptional regulator [Lachnospiraceae bacterium]|nr:winged helix-turn-helix transcriptional regulator [Lachnospiraceae bacterium]
MGTKKEQNTMNAEAEQIREKERIENELYDLAELFKIFGDSTRIRILYDLMRGEKNVTEIAEDLSMNQSAISHQLKILRTSRLIRSRREGKAMVYSLADEHVKTIIAMGKEHIEE